MRTWAVASVAAVGLAVAETPTPTYLQDPAKWGRLSRVVEPTYPADALARRQTGVIEVDGIVSGTGVLRNAALRQVTPQSEAFLESVREALPMWRFVPPLGTDCLPSRKVVTTRVSFELEGETPRIFVEHAKLPGPAQGRLGTVFRTQPRYPRSMLRDGVQANVYAKLDIDSIGRVTQVSAKAFTTLDDERTNLEPFEKEVVNALKLWMFTPLDDGQATPRAACWEVQFRTRN